MHLVPKCVCSPKRLTQHATKTKWNETKENGLSGRSSRCAALPYRTKIWRWVAKLPLCTGWRGGAWAPSAVLLSVGLENLDILCSPEAEADSYEIDALFQHESQWERKFVCLPSAHNTELVFHGTRTHNVCPLVYLLALTSLSV